MKATRIGVATLVMTALVSMGAADDAHAKDPEIKKLMGDNFANTQAILTALIMTDYREVPARIKAIEDHATELAANVPEHAKSDRDRFVSYAYNLRSHASDIESIVGLLIEHDKARPDRAIATDQLREAAAAHYGGMVTMCVACHNRFRPLDLP